MSSNLIARSNTREGSPNPPENQRAAGLAGAYALLLRWGWLLCHKRSVPSKEDQ